MLLIWVIWIQCLQMHKQYPYLKTNQNNNAIIGINKETHKFVKFWKFELSNLQVISETTINYYKNKRYQN